MSQTTPAIDIHQWCKKRWTTASRYYVVEIKQNLFGEWLIERRWGGLKNHRGNCQSTTTENYHHALSLLDSIEKRRKTRGYHLSLYES